MKPNTSNDDDKVLNMLTDGMINELKRVSKPKELAALSIYCYDKGYAKALDDAGKVFLRYNSNFGIDWLKQEIARLKSGEK